MARLATEKRSLGWHRERVWGWVILCCILLFVAAVRFRLRDMPLERDEGEYAYAGQLLLQGVLPGQAVYTMKLPGTHAVYGLLMSLFGQSCAGIHLGFLLVNWATIVLLFLFTRALMGATAGCTAAATYALISLSGDVLGTAAHATHFVVLPAVAGLLLLWHASRSGRLAAYLAAGFLLGSSVLMKHNGLFFILLGVLWLIWLGCSQGPGPNTPLGKAVALYLTGAAIPLLFVILVLWWAGTLENQWFWSVSYARAYAKPNPGVVLIWLKLIHRMPPVLLYPFYAALLGLVLLWARRGSRSVALFATGFLVLSLFAVVPGFHFRPHYYVLMMPVLAFLTGALVQQTTELLAQGRFRLLSAVPILAFAVLFARGIMRERNFFFHMSPVEACRSLYGFQPFPEAIVLADYIRAHSQPDARIAVVGSEPEILFYTQRRSATGYVYTYPLAERQPFAAQMRQQMIREIETVQPQFLVQARNWGSWLSQPGAQKRIDELCAMLTPPQYKLVATCDFYPNESRVAWQWHPAPITPPVPSTELLLFERITPADPVDPVVVPR